MNKKILLLLGVIACSAFALFSIRDENDGVPVVAIANYGPHASLEDSIKGFKTRMVDLGYVENKDVRYILVDVGFDTSLIPQTISRLKMVKPKVMLTMATPIAQYAKGSVKDIPLVYSVVTEPFEAGLLESEYKSATNMTGSSDRQDMAAFLEFAKSIFPDAKSVGLLYSNAENNDHALLCMLKDSAVREGLEVVAVAVNQSRDIPAAMQNFKGKVDFIYVGSSGVVQPALPMISAEAKRYRIPVFNFDSKGVYDGMALASFGVDYEKVGANAANLVSEILKGKTVESLIPQYPCREDHLGVVDQNALMELGISPDLSLPNTKYIRGSYVGDI